MDTLATAALTTPELATGQAPASGQQVVVYTSVDQNFAEPILAEFEAASGIDVQPVFDVEAAKTTGLVNRIIAEKDRPQADVWWSGECAQTIDLARLGYERIARREPLAERNVI